MEPNMKMTAVPDGKGGFEHRMVPASAAPQTKGRKQAYVPDPIRANPEAAAQQLKLFIERLENLAEEQRGVAEDIKDVLAEAKATGFDTKGIKSILALRKMDGNTRAEMTAILDTYKSALGLDF